MKLENGDGASFSLEIVRYEYPDTLDHFWDSNWLFVHIQIQISEQALSITDPCLATFEIPLIIDWLQRFAMNGAVKNGLTFLEPTIQFKCHTDRQGAQSLRVVFQPTPQRSTEQMKGNILLDFPLRHVLFKEIIENLQTQLDRFPQRVFRDRCLLTISGLISDEAATIQKKLKKKFENQATIRKIDLRWITDQGIIMAIIVHDYPRQTTREAAREAIRGSAVLAINPSPEVSLAISDPPS